MPTTSNFGWTTPADTDLVKDGAAAMRTLGGAIDTSLVDLKGGTTDQVLAKNSNTDMDFKWVDTDDTNAIQNAIVDAKGDLIAASAADTPARLAVGNNGETLLADSASSTGLSWSAQPAASNPVINSAMQIWQRGTTFSSITGAFYAADRWSVFRSGQATSASRQVTGDTTNLPNIEYCIRVQRDSGNTSTNTISLLQPFESVNSKQFAGKTVTFSFYARKGADYSAASSVISARLRSGTGTDQYEPNGYTGSVFVVQQDATLTATWQRFTYTGTVPTDCNELSIRFIFTPVGTASTNDYFEITGVQVDVGSVALPFRTQGVTLQGELAACQRYYNRVTSANGDVFTHFLSGIFASSTQFRGIYDYPVQMRVAPTSVDYSGNFYAQDFVTGYGGTVITLQGAGIASTGVNLAVTGATAGRAGILFANNSTAVYFGLSAEL